MSDVQTELEDEEAPSAEILQNEELQEYISEMLLLISTGDEEADMANVELISENIHTKAVQIHSEYQNVLKEN